MPLYPRHDQNPAGEQWVRWRPWGEGLSLAGRGWRRPRGGADGGTPTLTRGGPAVPATAGEHIRQLSIEFKGTRDNPLGMFTSQCGQGWAREKLEKIKAREKWDKSYSVQQGRQQRRDHQMRSQPEYLRKLQLQRDHSCSSEGRGAGGGEKTKR